MTPILLLALIPYSAALTAFAVFYCGFAAKSEGGVPAALAAVFGGLICVHVMLASIAVTCGVVIFFGG